MFKQPEIPKFRYVPRYYDPKKEAKDVRMKRADEGSNPPEPGSEEEREAFRERLHATLTSNSLRQRSQPFYSSSIFRFFAILLVLIFATLFLYAKYGDRLISLFVK